MKNENNELFNSFTCMGFSAEQQKVMNELIIFIIDKYIDYMIRGKEVTCDALCEDKDEDIPKMFFLYAMDLLLSGLLPEAFRILMQNYYDSKMSSLEGRKNFDDIRLQMLFVLQASLLLHEGRRKRFLDKSAVYIIMTKETELFTSNCDLLDLYIQIIRGVDEADIKNRTPFYKHYLNCMYMFNEAYSSLK